MASYYLIALPVRVKCSCELAAAHAKFVLPEIAPLLLITQFGPTRI